MKISDIKLKIIPDSRGDDTLEAEFSLGDIKVLASIPSGKSKGALEACVLEPKLALEKFNLIKPQILEGDFETVEKFDEFLIALDGTDNKKNSGGNLILVLSIGFTKLLAKHKNIQIFQLIAEICGEKIGRFPFCFYNVIEGGVHANNSLPFQEYLFIPQTPSPKESLSQVMVLIKSLGDKIHAKFGGLKQGDEGGYTIPSHDPAVGLEILQGIQVNYGQNQKWLGLDAAASTFFKNGKYVVGGKEYTSDELKKLYVDLANKLPVLYMEDIFDEGDWEGFTSVTREIGDEVWIVGDDLTTTNSARIKQARDKNAINAVIIKPTQIGTVTETIQAANLAKSYGWKIIVSHRSGETEDTFIADLAVGLQADGLKAGCPLKKERLVKYQRLTEIENLCLI